MHQVEPCQESSCVTPAGSRRTKPQPGPELDKVGAAEMRVLAELLQVVPPVVQLVEAVRLVEEAQQAGPEGVAVQFRFRTSPTFSSR